MKKTSKKKEKRLYAYQWLDKNATTLILLLIAYNNAIYCIIFGVIFFVSDVVQSDAGVMEVAEKTLVAASLANIVTIWLALHIICRIYDKSFEKRFRE